ncbi:right-handed parallel beta-helix repeat-containing protein [Dyadobacter subterraneus]|uniref:Right-handed parallel beta-helix repeat-containing protein n=1 Tax=Dyadobacter subterraneus TaxID=2773304 RepID=A0ABR9WHN9_9BACT|nr:right-handed parallel beta-helix repeat-containing protein [Dyadobacter subterraneus]MBE9465028.1 right-handed parallel beta-helix repeat-containing protein [Dyadobacter subterraneus]
MIQIECLGIPSRPVQSLLKEINPIQFGAKGDGLTDDTKALQSAIDAAKLENKNLNLQNYRYRTSQPLVTTLSSNESLIITGKGAIVDLVTNGLVVNSLDKLDNNGGTLNISGVTFQAPRFGDHYNTLHFINAILINRIDKIIIANCKFVNIYGNGIALMGYCKEGVINDNTFQGVHGFLEVKINNLYDCYGDGILIQDHCENLKITKNNIRLLKGQKGRCGIAVDYYSANITITNNVITGYDRCIHIESSNHINISNNKAIASFCGILVSSSTNININYNIINGQNPLNPSYISHPGLLFSYNSNQCNFSKNVIKGWTKQKFPTYSIKLWGDDIIFKENINWGGPVYAYRAQSGLFISNNKFYNSTIDFSLNKRIFIIENKFFSSPLLLNSTENCQVISNSFSPVLDSLFSEKIQVYSSKNVSFSNNKIYSANDFFIDNFNSHSFSIIGNILYKRKKPDGSRILKIPNSDLNKKKYNLLDDIESGKKIEI